MKRYAFLTLIFFAMVVAIQLASCTPEKAASPVPTVEQAASTTQAAPLPNKPTVLQPTAEPQKPTVAPTSAPTLLIPVTAPEKTQAALYAEVSADSLNVRVGPGLNHRIMAKLAAGQKVYPEGRSVTSEWIAVRLADGSEGWVYSSYLSPSGDLAALPVMEAYGGPVTTDPQTTPTAKPAARRYTLNISIGYSQAEVSMAGFAADSDISLILAAPGEDLSMTVAITRTDAQGSSNLTFDMPTHWPDGSAITQNALELRALGPDGKMAGKAKIIYQPNE